MGQSVCVYVLHFTYEAGNLHDQGKCCTTMGTVAPFLGYRCVTMGNEVIAGTHCYATITMHHISVTITYVMWHEKHLWNAKIL
jgi:hypothetical protein